MLKNENEVLLLVNKTLVGKHLFWKFHGWMVYVAIRKRKLLTNSLIDKKLSYFLNIDLKSPLTRARKRGAAVHAGTKKRRVG